MQLHVCVVHNVRDFGVIDMLDTSGLVPLIFLTVVLWCLWRCDGKG